MSSENVLKSFRTKRNITQENIANKLGISRQTYNAIENNLLDVSYETTYKILEILEVNELELSEFFNALKQDYLSYR